MTGQQTTWMLRRDYHRIWETDGGKPPGWLPLGLVRLDCGCTVDTYNGSMIWEPCMAHEADGHLAAISEVDGQHVARCLVMRCGWHETHLWANDAISAAQGHWRKTRAQVAGAAASSS